MLYSAQIRAARALLNWSQADLAKKAGIGIATVQRMEAGEGLVPGNVSTAFRVQQALEKGGVGFLSAEGGSGIGVRLRTQR